MNENDKDIIETKPNNNSLLFKIKKSALFERLSKIKNIKSIVAIVLFSVVVLIVMNTSFTTTKSTSESSTNRTTSTNYISSKQYVQDLEGRLSSVLSCIKGAGQTRVMITIENGPQIKLAESVEEKTITTSSGSTVTVVTNPILIDVSGVQEPLILMEVVPKVEGVIVVCAGANDIGVRLNMLYAIKALIDVPNDNIQIFAGT